MMRAVKFILKLMLKVIVLPFYLVSLAIWAVAELLSHVGSVALGAVMLILIYGIITMVMSRNWSEVFLAAVLEVFTVGILFFSGILLELMKEANISIGKFLLS